MERLERSQNEPLRDPLTGLKNLHGLRRAVEARDPALGGVAMGEAADTLESLRHRADEALYDAKDAGRNRVALASRLGSRSAPL